MKNILPLDGIRVLDLSRFFPGQYVAMLLADAVYTLDRSKKRLALNLRADEAKDIFYSLAGEAYVIKEGVVA